MTCGHYEILRLRGKRNEINPPTPAGISHIPQGSYFVEKNPLLSGRQKRVLKCERLPKRSRIEVRKPKSSVFALFYKLEPVERFSIDKSKDRLAGFLLLHPH